MATISSVLEHKISVEKKKLVQKLGKQLCEDVFKLYSQSIFTDLCINIDNECNVLKSHRCILQTRAPTFYNTYCAHPDLINYVPVQELQIFIKEIYCDSEIRLKEEKILQYIDNFFIDIERNHYSDITSSNCVQLTHQSFSDFPKLNIPNPCRVNPSYFRSNSDNSVYYSLVDRSLVLSDYSDINEENTEMNNYVGRLESSTSEINKVNIDDVICSRANDQQTCSPIQQFVSSNIPTSQGLHDQSKKFKCFIDASDLIDEEDKDFNDLEVSKTRTIDSEQADNDGIPRPDTKISKSNVTNEIVFSGKEGNQTTTYVSLSDNTSTNADLVPKFEVFMNDNDAEIQKITSSSSSCSCNVFIDGKMRNEDSLLECPSPRNSPIEQFSEGNDVNDVHRKHVTEEDQSFFDRLQNHEKNEIAMNTVVQASVDSDDVKKNFELIVCDSSCVAENCSNFENLCCHKKEVSYSTDMVKLREAFPEFKTYLNTKYECAKSNHEYSAGELQHLKEFDKLLVKDVQFFFLQFGLEEILISPTISKTDVAVYKFLIKQYEKNFSCEKVLIFIQSLMKDLLKGKSGIDFADSADSIEIDSLFKKLLSSKSSFSSVNTRKFEPSRQLVTNSKSCGFFIDLNDTVTNPNPVSGAKGKTLPPKQLFSMFIDFGNSTDSDSSIEVQNKFERRKKHYITKMEKSKELRNSTTSLSHVDESCRLNETSENSCSIKQEPTSSSMSVVRRQKNIKSSSVELRRSWNLEKTCEINTDTINKHRRSYSVSENNPLDKLNIKEEIPSELPSIGNADSTNELTINGESEISNSMSFSEYEQESKLVSVSSNSKTYPKSPFNSEESSEKVKENNFVKLSDMDKVPKPLSSSEPWPSVRMTKSVTSTDSNWLESKFLNGSVNSHSLSRIFPDLNASILSKPNSDIDDTTISSLSSVQSSSAVSTCESNLDSSGTVNKTSCNTLGQDLLRMFLDEISTDVVVEVAGRRIKAHKCILTSRCQYFAALLSGGWVESAGNVLSIHGFSYSVVHFALCYIYSGESEIPQNINVVELANLADYLCLEGLKEVVSSFLKMKYCHFFHKPCNICSVGVLECLPIAINYGLDELHRKSLRWIAKYFVRLWCTKAFASLPVELIDKCCNQHVVNMTVNNVFETLLNCDKLFSVIPQTRWAEPCYAVSKNLHNYCIKFLANHFLDFLKSESFSSFASNRTWGIVIIDEKTQHVCNKMKSDQLCLSYAYVCDQHKSATTTHDNEELIELLSRVKNRLEATLVKSALQASQCSAWFSMNAELRSHIQVTAGLTFLPNEVKRRPDFVRTRQSVVSSGSRAADLQQVKSAINRQHKQNNVRCSEPRETRQSVHQRLSSVQTRSSSARHNVIQDKENRGTRHTTNSSKSPYRNKYVNVKSRYMERKNDKNDKIASETTPSETSEIEKKSELNKRPSKSLVSSLHMSPIIRQTARAVSLSKIPVSVRTPSQKRHESDKDTTSGSDNGIKNDVHNIKKTPDSRSDKRTPNSGFSKATVSHRTGDVPITRKSYSGSSRSRSGDEKLPRTLNRSYMKTTQSTSTKAKNMINSSNFSDRNKNYIGEQENNRVSKVNSIDNSSDKKCSLELSVKNSLSENVVSRPNVPLRRDGTFCIEEPTVLKKHSHLSDYADDV